MKKDSINLRAHHGMCLAFFKGKGYSNTFTVHMQKILDKMQENPKLRIVAEGDIICSRCPNLQNGICNTPEQVEKYDREVLLQCGISENEEICWEEFSKRIEEKILLTGQREEICGDCQWSELCK